MSLSPEQRHVMRLIEHHAQESFYVWTCDPNGRPWPRKYFGQRLQGRRITLAALARKGLIRRLGEWYVVTDAGREVMKREGERRTADAVRQALARRRKRSVAAK